MNPNATLTLKLAVRLTVIAAAITLGACSSFESDSKVDYRGAAKVPTLVVPPDLTQLSRDSRYVVDGGVVSASSFQGTQGNSPTPTAITQVGDARIERSGEQRVLVVNRPAEQLWDTVNDFWKESGFTLVESQQPLGLIETEWTENRAKLPQDAVRKALGKVFDSLYSTGERDKFRTRLERNAAGGTDIIIAHRGLAEAFVNSAKDQVTWVVRPSDRELEVEMTTRLLVRLGAGKVEAKAIVAADSAATARASAQITTVNGQSVVQLSEGFDRAWRRVGLSLDRTGFTVEDRDRSQGIYFVRYVEPSATRKESGFFSKLFGLDNEGALAKYRVMVRSQGDVTTISVLNDKGLPDTTGTSQRIVKVLADELK